MERASPGAGRAARLLAGLLVLGALAATVMALAPLVRWWSEPGGSKYYDPTPTGFEAMGYQGWEFPGLHCPVDDTMGGECEGVVLTGGLPLLSGVLIVALASGAAWALWRHATARRSMVVAAAAIAGASAAAAAWTASTIGALAGPGIRIWLLAGLSATTALVGCLGLSVIIVRRRPGLVLLESAESCPDRPTDWLVAAAVVGFVAVGLAATRYRPLDDLVLVLMALALVFLVKGVRSRDRARSTTSTRRCRYCDAPLRRWARRCRVCRMAVRATTPTGVSPGRRNDGGSPPPPAAFRPT